MVVTWATTGSWGADIWRAFAGATLAGEVVRYRRPASGIVFVSYARRAKVGEHDDLVDAQAVVGR